MGKPKLPIYDLDMNDFSKFKKKYLDVSGPLSEETIHEIGQLFGLDKKEISSLFCDEYHAHSFRCIHYNSPEAGIIKRLLNERNYYKNLLGDIKNKIESSQLPLKTSVD